MGATLLAKKKRNDVTAKIDAEIMHMARVICAHLDGMPLAEYLSEKLRPIITEEYEQYRPAKNTKRRSPPEVQQE